MVDVAASRRVQPAICLKLSRSSPLGAYLIHREKRLMTTLKRRMAAMLPAAICITALATTGEAHAALVPNMYHCSIYTNQCWQTNPPHVASIINKCYWYSDFVYNAAYAPDTCDKYTSR